MRTVFGINSAGGSLPCRVFAHIIHLTMKAFFDPLLMIHFRMRQVRISNTNIGKPQLTPPSLDVIGKLPQILSNGGYGSHG